MNNHDCVGLVLLRRSFRWGYRDDHSTVASYSTGAAGREANDARPRV